MTPEFITGFFFEAIKTAVILSAPMLLAGLAIGLLVSIFQAATSINEMTLTFIPKMLAVAVALIFFFPWMMQTMVVFTTNLFKNIMLYVR
jgi:flagellar biosynthesis protein FliQ